jgi:BirA family biotin operon repressor/biotin-[acetyl-CoA-carboxylase] ligase
VARLRVGGVPAEVLGRRWAVPRCVLFGQLPSTLDAIHDLAAQDAPSGTVVIADEQTAGRGRDGRSWHSPPGGAWIGVLVRPPMAATGVLSIRAGLVIADVVDDLLAEARAQVKWPNDVMLDDRKLAGVLCEARWQGGTPQWLAMGVGVNVENAIPAEIASQANSLQAMLPDVRLHDVLDRLIPALVRLTAHGGQLTAFECAAFDRRDWLRGRALRAPVMGRAAGIRADGALFVDNVGTGATAVVRDGHVELS